MLACGEWLSDDGQSTFSTSNQQEPPIFGNDESEHRLDQIIRRNIDPLQWSHEGQLSDDDVASFGSIDESLHEVCVLNDLRCHDLAAFFGIVLDQHVWLRLELIQVLTVD